MIPYVEQPDLK
jgi:hypothetical protein